MSALDKFEYDKNDKSIPKYRKATIYYGLIRLHHKIRSMCFCMSKTDRIEYGRDLKKSIAECIKDFVIAFDFESERPLYYMKLVADFHYLTTLVDEIDTYRILRIPHTDIRNGTNTKDLIKKPEKLILQVYEEIGKIDEDISKWRNSAMRICSSSSDSKILNVEGFHDAV